MADDEKKPIPLVDITDPSIPDLYAQLVNVSVGQSDVVVCFARQLENLEGHLSMRPVARITFTHETFINVVAHLASYSHFLTTVYADNWPALREAQRRDPQRFRDALEVLLGIPQPPPEEPAKE